ncbi:hypothetical protein M0811_07218 [Anaeramoeba ignava]|uniref:Uncharacterized protein n=1 Tax=Anaeramoeba ignava TaxID=1746090 RepID=A0A9Q0LMQ2_ANAIG|nr:hypothetical protein M0811_07218 [Anaeramoeba ignava]
MSPSPLIMTNISLQSCLLSEYWIFFLRCLTFQIWSFLFFKVHPFFSNDHDQISLLFMLMCFPAIVYLFLSILFFVKYIFPKDWEIYYLAPYCSY